ncbi:MAG TPA: NAD(P)/FAD-dependent oxidoreductase, partial [Burkholderiales bacterium]|nr:NAD(P)/FAD-dependent oxidoreductase [Burkholderiales bacterium]
MNPAQGIQFDLVVIGSGPGGYKAATGAARLGAAVALVERALDGGTCLNEGCVPSDALLHTASLIDDVRALAGKGLTGDLAGDFGAAARRKDAVVASMRAGVPHALKRLGIRQFRGVARFESGHQVRVDGVGPNGGKFVLRAPCVIIATGSRPRALAQCPFDGATVVSSREFYAALQRLPERILIVGGGAIGVETAYLASQFGARVTLVERAPRLLPDSRVTEDAADLLESRLERLGVEVRARTAPAACRVRDGHAHIVLDDGSEADYGLVLVAVGRAPSSAGLGLEAAGVATTPGGAIRTDAYLETDAKGIYAIGDVRAGPMTANAALYDAKVVVANALGGERVPANYSKVPFVVRSALEIASVGFSAEQAEQAGFAPQAARAGFLSSVKARARHGAEGFVDVIHDVETGQLLGGCVVGPHAGEQILLLGAACQSPRGLWLFKDLSYSHPSWSEEIENAIDPCAVALARTAENLFR